LVLDENFLSAYLNKSNAHIELEQYTEAIDTYKEALAIDSENSYILYCMGECYLDMNDLEKAEKHFLDSIMMSDLLSDAWIGLSSVYEEQNKFDRAINCIKKAIEIDNDNVDYIQYLARIYHLTDDTENAIKSYREALRLLPESIDTWIDLAELYYTDLENSDEAIAILKESITTLGRIDYEVITRMSTYLFLTGAIESAELLLLTIDDESFDYTGKMILYESTLINNPTFWAMVERVKPNEKI
jgi:tetratricopeptide (TPR) repeat protein